MKFAVLLTPHANIRYQKSIESLALAEGALLLGSEHELSLIHRGGAPFLCFEHENETYARRLAFQLSSAYVVFACEGDTLVPLEKAAGPLGDLSDLSGVLKYKGKTNEMFTSMLVNVAVFSGEYANRFDERLQVLDPICGRGTTLYEAIAKGYAASGVEIDKKDCDEVRKYFKKYLEMHRFKHETSQTNLTVKGKSGGTKYTYTFAADGAALKQNPLRMDYVLGNTLYCPAYFKRAQFHAIVADLPYGVQHSGLDGKRPIAPGLLLEKSVGAWKEVLKPGGAIAVAFNVNTLPKEKARAILEGAGLKVLSGGPYDAMEHWVEQAVTRDIAVAVLE